MFQRIVNAVRQSIFDYNSTEHFVIATSRVKNKKKNTNKYTQNKNSWQNTPIALFGHTYLLQRGTVEDRLQIIQKYFEYFVDANFRPFLRQMSP